MFPARDVGGTICSLAITNRQIDNFAVEFGSTKDQVIIAEWVKISEIGTVRRDLFIVAFPQHFCATQCILDGLSEQPRERHAEELVPEEIERTHGFFLHRINQAYAVDKFPFPGNHCLIETRKVFRWHSEISIENH